MVLIVSIATIQIVPSHPMKSKRRGCHKQMTFNADGTPKYVQKKSLRESEKSTVMTEPDYGYAFSDQHKFELLRLSQHKRKTCSLAKWRDGNYQKILIVSFILSDA